MGLRLSSTKLNKEIVDNMCLLDVSSYEVDFILYLAFRQNSLGVIEEVFYSDVMEFTGMSKQTFYNVKNRLEKNGFIEATQNIDGYWRITILNNDFSSSDKDKKGYINIKYYSLKHKDFLKLKAKEKLLVLKFLNTYPLKEGLPLQIYISTLKKWLNVKSSYCIYNYIKSIKKYFDYTIHDRKDLKRKIVFMANKAKIFLPTGRTDKELYYMHKIKMFCNKNKISNNPSSIYDIIILINQYGFSKVLEALEESFNTSKVLQPKLINFIINKEKKYM